MRCTQSTMNTRRQTSLWENGASCGVSACGAAPSPMCMPGSSPAFGEDGASHGVSGRALRLVHSLNVGQEPRARALAHHLLLVVAQQHLPRIVGVPAQPITAIVRTRKLFSLLMNKKTKLLQTLALMRLPRRRLLLAMLNQAHENPNQLQPCLEATHDRTRSAHVSSAREDWAIPSHA